MHPRSSWRMLVFRDRVGPILSGNDIGINLTATLLTRHKYHCMAVKNPLTRHVDNRSSLTLRPGFRVAATLYQLGHVSCRGGGPPSLGGACNCGAGVAPGVCR